MEITNRTGILKTVLNGSVSYLSAFQYFITYVGSLLIRFVLFAHSMMSRLSCQEEMGIRELLDGKIWEWDSSFRWEWEWSHWNGKELVRKICSRKPLPSTPRTKISTKVEVNIIIPSCNVFAADTLRDLVTLTSDALTMNSCHANCRSRDQLHYKNLNIPNLFVLEL